MASTYQRLYSIKNQTMDWDSIQFPAINTKPQTFTPMYLTEDYQSEFDNMTTYSSMNDWMRMQGQVMNSKAPSVMYSGAQGFKEVPQFDEADQQTNSASVDDYNDKFERSYTDLAHQIAYRYPNPGLPRTRTGAIGGTWRHIKEVLSDSGSRVCFVDGLVSVYDTEKFSEALQPPLPYKGKFVTPPYAPTPTEYTNGKNGIVLPPLSADMQRKIRLNSQPRTRGHYQFK